jgi:hypothetical protein
VDGDLSREGERVMSARGSILAVAAASLAMIGCLDFLTPGGEPALVIVSGGVTDTIDAIPRRLVVKIENDQAPSGRYTAVEFIPVIASEGAVEPIPWVEINHGPGPNLGWQAFPTEVPADGDGQASVAIRLGQKSGIARLVVHVPAYDLTDTVLFTIRPGRPVGAAVFPKDTIVPLGASLSYRGGAVDRGGNPGAGPATFSGGPGIQVESGGRVTASSLGSFYVKVQTTLGSTVVADSARLAVPPPGKLVWFDWDIDGQSTGALMIGDVGGTNARVLRRGAFLGSSWHPSNQHVATILDDKLVLVDLQGNVTPVPTVGIEHPRSPEYSPDGRWIYFHRYGSGVYRVRPDGTEMTSVTGEFGGMPAISPDGTTLAFVTGEHQGELWLQSLVTGERQRPDVWMESPRWSADGQWISFAAGDDSFWMVRRDGTQAHQVAQGERVTTTSPSPDGRWLIAGDGRLQLVDLVTGVVTKGWLGRFPAWSR